MKTLLILLLLSAGCSHTHYAVYTGDKWQRGDCGATWSQPDRVAEAWAEANRAAKEARHD